MGVHPYLSYSSSRNLRRMYTKEVNNSLFCVQSCVASLSWKTSVNTKSLKTWFHSLLPVCAFKCQWLVQTDTDVSAEMYENLFIPILLDPSLCSFALGFSCQSDFLLCTAGLHLQVWLWSCCSGQLETARFSRCPDGLYIISRSFVSSLLLKKIRH